MSANQDQSGNRNKKGGCAPSRKGVQRSGKERLGRKGGCGHNGEEHAPTDSAEKAGTAQAH